MTEEQKMCRQNETPVVWEEHSRVPCFHVLSRCSTNMRTTPTPTTATTTTSNHPTHCPRRDCDRDAPAHLCEREDIRRQHCHHHVQTHHHHHHHHHLHHELHTCSSTQTKSTSALISSFLSKASVNGLLRVLVFLLSWAAVCAAPSRTMNDSSSGSLPEITNSLLQLSRNSSNGPMVAIRASEIQLPPSPPRLPGTQAKGTTSESATPSMSTASTDRGPFASIDDLMGSVAHLPGAFPAHMSHRVAFSAERPQSPPWPSDVTFDPSDEEDVQDEEGDVSNSTHSRRRRSTRSYDLEEVCASSSKWGKKVWALDVYKMNVTILSKIQTAGRGQVDQWFYETSCDTPNHRCKGIDTYFYESFCRSKYAWVYAMIRTEAGEEGWNWIRINASCNCAIRRKTHHGHGHGERCRVAEGSRRRKR